MQTARATLPHIFLTSACFYNFTEISGAEDDNWFGVVKLAYRERDFMVMAVEF